MAINFPHPATPDQTHSHNGKTWKWNGTSWNMQSSFTTGGGVNAGGGNVAVGTIALWSGSVSNIPAGWQLCDGTNGSPDLRDKFVIGAGNSYNVGVTGGSKDAVVVEHDHDINDSGHTHRPLSSSNNSTTVMSVEVALDGTTEKYCAAIGSGATVNNASNTTEEDTGISIQNEGSTGVNANLPPYYSLCYIYCNTSGGVPVPSYTDSDVDSHLNQNDPTDGYVLSWNGTDYEWVEQSGGISGINIKDDQGGTGGNPNDLGNATGLLFNGDGVQASGAGSDQKTITIPGGIQVKNDGTNLTTTCFALDFRGDGVTASRTDATKWIDIPGYANSDVDTHLNKSTASPNEVLSWNGTDYDWITVSGGGDKIQENDTSVECIDDGTGDRIEFKTSGTEAVQIDANNQILISGSQTGDNIAKIYNTTDGLSPSTGILGIFASSNNATPRDVRFYSGGGTANETLRIGKSGEIGVGGDVGTSGKVLTSGGAGAAATWEDASGGTNTTYSLEALLSTGIKLTGSDSTSDSIFFDTAGGISITRTVAPGADGGGTIQFDTSQVTGTVPILDVTNWSSTANDNVGTSKSGTINRAAFEKAIGSLSGTGGIIYVPHGDYEINGTINITNTGTNNVGDGGGIVIMGPNYRVAAADAEGARLIATDATSDIFKITNVRSVEIKLLSFDTKTGTTRTGGNAIHCYSNTNTQQIKLERLYIRNQFGGIKMDGHSMSILRDIEMRTFNDASGSYGLLLSCSAAPGGTGSEKIDQIRCQHVLIDGAAGTSNPGGASNNTIGIILADRVNSVWFENCVANRCLVGMDFQSSLAWDNVPGESGDNPASFFRLNSCDFDTNSFAGIHVQGGSFIWINSPYISSNKYNGIRTTGNETTGFRGVLRINDADCRGNSEHGIFINSTHHKKVFINNPQCCSNGAGTWSGTSNSCDGIHVSNNVNDIQIIGGQCGGKDAMGSTDGGQVNASSTQERGIHFVSTHNRCTVAFVDCTDNKSDAIDFNTNGGSYNFSICNAGEHTTSTNWP